MGIAYDKMFNTLDRRADACGIVDVRKVQHWIAHTNHNEPFGAGIWLEHQPTPARTQQQKKKNWIKMRSSGMVCVRLEQHLWKAKGVCRCHLHMRRATQMNCVASDVNVKILESISAHKLTPIYIQSARNNFKSHIRILVTTRCHCAVAGISLWVCVCVSRRETRIFIDGHCACWRFPKRRCDTNWLHFFMFRKHTLTHRHRTTIRTEVLTLLAVQTGRVNATKTNIAK